MTAQQEAAIARVCAHECLQRELVNALEEVRAEIHQYAEGFDLLWAKVDALIARAKEQQS